CASRASGPLQNVPERSRSATCRPNEWPPTSAALDTSPRTTSLSPLAGGALFVVTVISPVESAMTYDLSSTMGSLVTSRTVPLMETSLPSKDAGLRLMSAMFVVPMPTCAHAATTTAAAAAARADRDEKAIFPPCDANAIPALTAGRAGNWQL